MKKSLVTEINFKKNNIFSPSQIINESIKHLNTLNNYLHNEGILEIKDINEVKIYDFQRDDNSTSIIQTKDNTIISFKKNKEGENTESFFVFDKVNNIDKKTKEELISLLDVNIAQEAIVINKKKNRFESILRIEDQNNIEKRTNQLGGVIKDFFEKTNEVNKQINKIKLR